MPVTLQCPRLNCRAILQVPDTVRGKRVRCGECGMTFMVPTNPAPLRPASYAAPSKPGPTGTGPSQT